MAPALSSSPATDDGLVRLSTEGDRIVIEADGIPNHATGVFPSSHCPFAIQGRRRRFAIARTPAFAAQPTPLGGWLFGVAVNGVVFDPTGPYVYDGQTRTDWEFEVMSAVARPELGLDQNNAHTQPSGEYHYHGLPVGLLDRLGAAGRVTLVGYAADGFPIYGPWGHADPADATSPITLLRSGYRMKEGRRAGGVPGGAFDGTFVQDWEWAPGVGDLDEHNGRVGVTPEHPEGIYHYVLTAEFPFVPRAWRGAPDPSFTHPSPGPNAVPRALRAYRGA